MSLASTARMPLDRRRKAPLRNAAGQLAGFALDSGRDGCRYIPLALDLWPAGDKVKMADLSFQHVEAVFADERNSRWSKSWNRSTKE
jgi:hypothetical protein